MKQSSFTKVLTEKNDSIIELANSVNKMISQNEDCIIIKESVFETTNINKCKTDFLLFCSLLGSPTPHIGNEYVWDIKAQPKNSSQYNTFSETNSSAPFHTDTQYREVPEKYMSLLSLKISSINEGLTEIINANNLIADFSSDAIGKEYIETLRTVKYPFLVPSIFSKEKLTPEIIYAKIIDDKIPIRYRYDSIIRGLKYSIKFSKKQVDAINYFDSFLNNYKNKETFLLNEGEVLIVNNYKILHSRTEFFNLNRHLLRVRFNRGK